MKSPTLLVTDVLEAELEASNLPEKTKAALRLHPQAELAVMAVLANDEASTDAELLVYLETEIRCSHEDALAVVALRSEMLRGAQ